MYWENIIFTFLDTNLLLKLFFKEKELFKKLAKSIITHYYSIQGKEIIFNNIFLVAKLFFADLKIVEFPEIAFIYQ